MATIASKLDEVSGRIARACDAAGRPVSSVTLLAVSKTFSADAVREAMSAGQARFGENYVQEALDKMAALAESRPQLEWHLIGPLQSNKTRVVAESFD
nr:YggS family pyridoxal phosphate enzyme [Methylibium sp.]